MECSALVAKGHGDVWRDRISVLLIRCVKCRRIRGPMKQSLADVPRLVSCVGIFGKVIKRFRDFAEAKINFQFSIVAPDNKMQQFSPDLG